MLRPLSMLLLAGLVLTESNAFAGSSQRFRDRHEECREDDKGEMSMRLHMRGPAEADSTYGTSYVAVTAGDNVRFKIKDSKSAAKVVWDGQMYMYPAWAGAAYGYVAILIDGVEVAQRYVGTNVQTYGLQYIPFHLEGFADDLSRGNHTFSLVYKAGAEGSPVFIDGRGYAWSAYVYEIER